MTGDPTNGLGEGTTTAEPGSPGGLTFLERTLEKLGSNARSASVYGAPVERDGVTVVPVAKVRWGFGGGEGDDRKGSSSGSGGGGGVTASPVGYIEIVDGTARFHRISDPTSFVPLVLVGGAVAWMLLRGLRKTVKTVVG